MTMAPNRNWITSDFSCREIPQGGHDQGPNHRADTPCILWPQVKILQTPAAW
jgi:hypothetical protein